MTPRAAVDGADQGTASPRSAAGPRGRVTAAGALSIGGAVVARVLLVPAGVAVGERGGAEAVGEDREADGQVDREHDQVLVGKVRLLDHDHREHDRRQPAGTEPAEEAERRRPGPCPEHRDRDREHPDEREAEDRVQRELPAQLAERGSEQDGPEEHEGDAVEHVPDLLAELVEVLGVAPRARAGTSCPRRTRR